MITTTTYRFAPLAQTAAANDWLTQATEADLTGNLGAAIELANTLECVVELRDEQGCRRGTVAADGSYQLS